MNESRKVTSPIMIIGVEMAVWMNAKLKPTIKASMLVATDKVNKA